MLFYVSPLILGYFLPASTLLHGHIALAILKFWSIEVTLLRITWTNHSILVSNVSMTKHGFSESNTSDWLPYVWARPQSRWRLRRLHILKYATQLSCNFQYSHCTFVTIRFRPFARLFINQDAIFHSMEWCKFLWGNLCKAIEIFYHWDFFSWDFGFSMHFSHSAA